MSKRSFLLGASAGFALGYAALRAWECFTTDRRIRVQRDAAVYGTTRRALTVASIARTMAGSYAFAFGAGAVERYADRFPVWLRPAAFGTALMALETLVDLPGDFLEGHILEHRYGLSEQSVPSWISDKIKEQLLATGLMALISTLLGAALRRWPRRWPAIASAGALPLLLIANVVVPIYVMPLFNKYEPLEGPLERRLRALASRFGVGDADILRVDMSRQTKKANAFVIGIGTTHRIVVGDTLIANFPDEEVEFVVAHELGHFVSKDTWRMIALAQATIVAVLIGTSLAMQRSPADAARSSSVARVQFWATLFSTALRPAICAFARSREWAADRFALAATQAASTGASAFRRLRDQNLAEDAQPKWYEFFFSTHPSLKARIETLDRAAPA